MDPNDTVGSKRTADTPADSPPLKKPDKTNDALEPLANPPEKPSITPPSQPPLQATPQPTPQAPPQAEEETPSIIIVENFQKLIREFFFVSKTTETKWKPGLITDNDFSSNVSKLHPLLDGITIFGASKPKQNFFTIDINRTLSTFGRDFEVRLAYFDAKLPIRKAQFKFIKGNGKAFETIGKPFELQFSGNNIETFISKVNSAIVTESHGVVTKYVPRLVFDDKTEKVELHVGKQGNDIYTLELDRKHTLDFLDFDFPQTFDKKYPNILVSKKPFSAFSHFFVYSSISPLSLVNGELRPLLAVLPSSEQQSSQYVPLGVDRFSKITFKLTDENLVLIPPTEEKAYVLLHFREKKKT